MSRVCHWALPYSSWVKSCGRISSRRPLGNRNRSGASRGRPGYTAYRRCGQADLGWGPGRKSGPCLSRRDHPGLTRRGLSPAVSERGLDHDRTSRWDLRAQRAGVCRVAQREPARIRLLGADQLHASGGMPQRAAASQARATAKLPGRGLGLARRRMAGPRSSRHCSGSGPVRSLQARVRS